MTGPRRVLLRAVIATSLSATLFGVVGAGGANADTSASTGGLDGAIEAALSAHELDAQALPAPPVAPAPLVFPTGPAGNPIVDSASLALRSLLASRPNTYREQLLDVAEAVSAVSGLPADQLATVWLRTDGVRMRVLLGGLTQVGVPYHYLGETPGRSFDCSGFVSWAWSTVGLALPHQSRSIINGVRAVTLETVQPGDVLYYPGHVMLALGLDGAYVHARQRGSTVEIRVTTRHRVRVGSPI